MQNWEYRSFNVKWGVSRFPYRVSDEMLFEDIVRLRRIQPPDIVAFKPAVSNGRYLEAGGINPEMVGDLFNCCGKVSGQGYSVGGDYCKFSSAKTLGRSGL